MQSWNLAFALETRVAARGSTMLQVVSALKGFPNEASNGGIGIIAGFFSTMSNGLCVGWSSTAKIG